MLLRLIGHRHVQGRSVRRVDIEAERIGDVVRADGAVVVAHFVLDEQIVVACGAEDAVGLCVLGVAGDEHIVARFAFERLLLFGPIISANKCN